MGKVTGFLEIDRQDQKYQSASDRIRHSREFTIPLTQPEVERQAARCMDCGIPYCHTGCPVNNQIPDWNDLVYHKDWQEALRNLHSTNNFPEFTGRVCPAPCEEACTLNLEDIPVTIKSVEQALIDRGFAEGWVKPEIAAIKTGKKIAVIGAGAAGLAAAQQLARAGHEVHVYEREAKAGGLLRYGIPDFKMEKNIIDRRLAQLELEGIIFHYNANIGVTISFADLKAKHDAVLMSGGAEDPRNPALAGQTLGGVHYAMPFLTQQNKRLSGQDMGDETPIMASGKKVVVIGGGDTASDCIGTSFRQGALKVTQLDIRPKPPENPDMTKMWPYWQTRMRTSSSQAEGAAREFQVATLEIVGKNGQVTGVKCAEVDEKRVPIAGTEFIIPADIVFLAIGFAGSLTQGLVSEAKVKLDKRNNVVANEQDYATSQPNVFVAGDMRRGQSLIVWAIREGRQAAHAIDAHLMGKSLLPR
jgi:glutamate synthase (NADPH) small chain